MVTPKSKVPAPSTSIVTENEPTTAITGSLDKPLLERVRVHISMPKKTGRVKITTSHTVGTTTAIINYLPRQKLRSYALNWRYEALEAIIQYSYPVVSLLEWQNAIAAEIIARLTATTTPDATELTTLTTSAYLALGTQLYQLQPIGIVQASGALKAMRTRLRSEMFSERICLLDEARANAAGIITAANARLEEANSFLANAKRAPTPPAWITANNLPTRYNADRGQWEIGIYFSFAIASFEWRHADVVLNRLEVRQWSPRPAPPIDCLCWTPIDAKGIYKFTTIHMDAASPRLPHMVYTEACMGPASAPARLSMNDYHQLASAITSTMSVVVMNSVLFHARHWDDRIKAFAPVGMVDHSINSTMSTFPCTNITVTTLTQESNETWSTA